jgi:hypothetical protein
MALAHAVTECVYEMKRNKPGLKYGAVENVHRRLGEADRPLVLNVRLTCFPPEKMHSNAGCSGSTTILRNGAGGGRLGEMRIAPRRMVRKRGLTISSRYWQESFRSASETAA